MSWVFQKEGSSKRSIEDGVQKEGKLLRASFHPFLSVFLTSQLTLAGYSPHLVLITEMWEKLSGHEKSRKSCNGASTEEDQGAAAAALARWSLRSPQV